MSYFAMKISGRPENVNDMVNKLREKWEGITRFDFVPSQFEANHKSRLISIVGEGNCLKTIEESMPGLREKSAKLGLCIEVFLSDTEERFQEHCLFDVGTIIEKQRVYYDVIEVEGMNEEIFESFLNCQNLDREEVLSNLNCCGQYIVGGLKNFGRFKDHFIYRSPRVPKHLSPKIDSPKEKTYLDYIIQDAALKAQKQPVISRNTSEKTLKEYNTQAPGINPGCLFTAFIAFTALPYINKNIQPC